MPDDRARRARRVMSPEGQYRSFGFDPCRVPQRVTVSIHGDGGVPGLS